MVNNMRKLSKSAYKDLIAEDVEWLRKQPDTLERQHIEVVLYDSVYQHYPDKNSPFNPETQRLIEENIELSNKLGDTLDGKRKKYDDR